MSQLRFSCPEVITKELKILNVDGRRKVRISSNWLPLVGFEPGIRHSITTSGDLSGMTLKVDSNGRQKVYQRSYKQRKNNPLETVVEIGAQSLLDRAFPLYTERVHFTMRNGEIVIRPLVNRTFSIRKGLLGYKGALSAMVAMTAGIDVHCIEQCGFEVEAVLEHRPPEKRDRLDLTETGALNVLANSSPRILLNEDISTIDFKRVESLLEDRPPIAMMHISLQCDEFSTAKSNSLKARAIQDLSTSRDLVYDALRLIETVRPACVLLEQVRGFSNSLEGELFVTKLRKWGYHVTESILKASKMGGLTHRERYYVVASVYPEFKMPDSKCEESIGVWDEISQYLQDCREVTENKAVQDGIAFGRARLIKPGDLVAPTVLKSQPRQTKDSVYIQDAAGRIFYPTEDVLRKLNGFPETICLRSTSMEVGAEIIGQSIDYPMHHAVVAAVHKHLTENTNGRQILTLRNKA